MPRIIDNISEKLLDALCDAMQDADSADFCVGYFNLRGWRLIRAQIDQLASDESRKCRILIGMNPSPDEELRKSLSLKRCKPLDQQQVLRRKNQAVAAFRKQLVLGAPTNADEQGLRDLADQLRSGKVAVKLFLRYPLHAKLYLIHKAQNLPPTLAFLGSSNLTLAGLQAQGELNTEVTDYDAGEKLKNWFEERWQDRWCLDISAELIDVIDQSWARKNMLSPYELYLKILYHLSREARVGIDEYQLPREFSDILLDYQAAAVGIAAQHLNSRGGVLLGDVVGLGKTLMATALARILQDDHSWSSLIICPPNLKPMWEQYREEYKLTGTVLSLGKVIETLPELRRYRIVIIDESHNLRSRDSKRYQAVRDYIAINESRCILLSATPYNKNYLDLSAQLRLFLDEGKNLGARPERYMKEIGEARFQQQFQAKPRSILAFEKSEHAEDWRRLMQLYLVRRTRSFIEKNFAETDPDSQRRFMRLANGERFDFPRRAPKTVSMQPSPQYQGLYSTQVIDQISELKLPRYGLDQYVDEKQKEQATAAEKRQADNLKRGGKRLMGFCRSNLFKRLESSGASFLQSVDRHITRNAVFLHALDNDLDLPIGSQDAHLLDPDAQDEDRDSDYVTLRIHEEDPPSAETAADATDAGDSADMPGDYARRAQAAYQSFHGRYKSRFKWLRASLFSADLRRDLQEDIERLSQVLRLCDAWEAAADTKLGALYDLISRQHKKEKVLVFSQFADTIRYLERELRRRGVAKLGAATGQHGKPTSLARRFSPVSNGARVQPENEIRVLLSTDVLSEGQNLQDCAIVVNYDLPWAIIRLSQRAGRVDRIGQKAEEIRCYSFLPADGVEEIIRLRARVQERLRENDEVVGSDERFFEGDVGARHLRDLYAQKDQSLNEEIDDEVDLSSHAFQLWNDATKNNAQLKKKIEALPDVVYSSRRYAGSPELPPGLISYIEASDEVNASDSIAALLWLDERGEIVTEDAMAIIKAAQCEPGTPARRRHPLHHELVKQAVDISQAEDFLAQGGGQLNITRRRTYEALKKVLADMPLFYGIEEKEALQSAIDDIYRHPLMDAAKGSLQRQLRHKSSDEDLAEMVIDLWRKDRLCRKTESDEAREPRILCSLGLFDD